MRTKLHIQSPFAMSLLAVSLIAAASQGFGQQASKPALPSISPLCATVESLVRQYYPGATLTNSATAIHFEYKARDFMVHEALPTGDWQDARQVRGPNRLGVVCDITLSPGKYENPRLFAMTAAPSGPRYWTHDKRYYRELLIIPYSKAQNCHLYVLLRVPADAPSKFIERFHEVISNFEAHLKSSS